MYIVLNHSTNQESYLLEEDLKKLVKSCLRNDSVAQHKLYCLYADKLFGVCLRYAKDGQEAQDILQDGFVKIFTKLEQFHFKGSLEGWMRRIVVNTALERFRSKGYLHSLQSYPLEDYDAAEDATVFQELAAQDLLDMIQELTPQYRMVFNLYAIEGYSHKEICTMLGIKEGTSKSNLSRAREILKEKVKAYYQVKEQIG